MCIISIFFLFSRPVKNTQSESLKARLAYKNAILVSLPPKNGSSKRSLNNKTISEVFRVSYSLLVRKKPWENIVRLSERIFICLHGRVFWPQLTPLWQILRCSVVGFEIPAELMFQLSLIGSASTCFLTHRLFVNKRWGNSNNCLETHVSLVAVVDGFLRHLYAKKFR